MGKGVWFCKMIRLKRQCLLPCRFFVLLVLVVSGLLAQSDREFEDIYGQTVTLPKIITRLYGSAPAVNYMAAVLDDTPLVGVCFPQRSPDNKDADKFLSNHFMHLPLLGGWFGHGVPSLEAILAKNPQVIITWDTPYYNDMVAKTFAGSGIPVLKMNFDDTSGYPDAFRYLGRILHKEKRAEALAQMAETYLAEVRAFVESIPEDQRVRVNYAEGYQGLQTECDVSLHSEPLILAGAHMVHECIQKEVHGLERVDFRQIMLYNPDVIIIHSPIFYRDIFTDLKWGMLKAVKHRRVYLIPSTPFNWLNYPFSFMRVLGVHWTASRLYPDRYPYDIRQKVRDFFKLFFNKELTDGELKAYFDL